MCAATVTCQPMDVWCHVRAALRGVPAQGEITTVQPAAMEGEFKAL